MDVDLLFALALLVFYLATQIFGRKKRSPQAPPADDPVMIDYEKPHSTEVDDALREIREALGWPSEQETKAPEPAPPRPQAPSGRPTERRTRLEETRKVRSSRTQERPSFLGDESEMNEWEVAQRRTAAKKAEATALYGAQGGIPEVKGFSRRRSVHPIAAKLRTFQGARDAVVYSEIFQARWKNDVD